mgnify:FL=1
MLHKDIQRLEYLHKFLIEAHQNREEAMRRLVEENRTLKVALETMKDTAFQKTPEYRDPTPFMNLPVPYIKKPSGINHIGQAIQQRAPLKKPDSFKFQIRR